MGTVEPGDEVGLGLGDRAMEGGDSRHRLLQRLEQAGFVRRVPDPADRRRVLVEPLEEPMTRVAALHRSIAEAQADLIAGFDDDALAAIAAFLERSVEVTHRETLTLRAPAREAGAGGSYAAPVGGVTEGHLVFVSGAPNVLLRGDPGLQELYRARFDGPVPRMRVRGGIVTVAYPRFGWFDWRAHLGEVNVEASLHWRKDRGEILVNPAVPWSVELRGGASRLTADLRLLRLLSVELRGGANRVEIQLPAPLGIVPIRIAGGMSQLTIHRPAGTATMLTLAGGVARMSLDGSPIPGGGRLSLQSPGADRQPNRFEIDVSGGASRVSIDTR